MQLAHMQETCEQMGNSRHFKRKTHTRKAKSEREIS